MSSFTVWRIAGGGESVGYGPVQPSFTPEEAVALGKALVAEGERQIAARPKLFDVTVGTRVGSVTFKDVDATDDSDAINKVAYALECSGLSFTSKKAGT